MSKYVPKMKQKTDHDHLENRSAAQSKPTQLLAQLAHTAETYDHLPVLSKRLKRAKSWPAHKVPPFSLKNVGFLNFKLLPLDQVANLVTLQSQFLKSRQVQSFELHTSLDFKCDFLRFFKLNFRNVIVLFVSEHGTL